MTRGKKSFLNMNKNVCDWCMQRKEVPATSTRELFRQARLAALRGLYKILPFHYMTSHRLLGKTEEEIHCQVAVKFHSPFCYKHSNNLAVTATSTLEFNYTTERILSGLRT